MRADDDEEDDEASNMSLAAMEAALKPKVLETLELIARDGSLRYWDYHNVVDTEEGEPYVLGYAQDVTVQIAQAQGELIYRAFENVIRNAVKYNPAGAAAVVALLALTARHQPDARVSVRDAAQVRIVRRLTPADRAADHRRLAAALNGTRRPVAVS